MASLLIPRPHPRTCLTRPVIWLCVFSLVVALANRVPRIPVGGQTSWVPSTPSQITAKVLSKEFFVLLPPLPGAIRLLRSIPSPLEICEERHVVSIFLDNHLFTRPPPSTLDQSPVS